MVHIGAQPALTIGAKSTPKVFRFALLATPLIGVTFLSKFGFPPLAALGVGVSLFLPLGALATGALFGIVSVEPRRTALFAAMLGVLSLIQIFQPDSFSPASLLLLVALHLPYIVSLHGSDTNDGIVRFLLGIVTIFAWCGIAQNCLHSFVSPHFLFPIENFTPNGFIVQLFNQQAATEYGSNVYRANGVFLLEPSFFSQVLAVAIIAELCTFGRVKRLAVYGLALIASYSGTGLIVLAVCLPLCVVAQRRWGLLVLGLLALAVIVAVQMSFHTHTVLSRIGEFDSDQSSGYSRFVGGFRLFDRFLWVDPLRALFGFGAGSYAGYSLRVHDFGAGEMALFKMVFEFGLIGAAAYFGFLFSCLYYSSAPRILIIAVAITYVLNGIYVPFAHGLALSLLLWNAAPGDHAWSTVIGRKRLREDVSITTLPAPRGVRTW